MAKTPASPSETSADLWEGTWGTGADGEASLGLLAPMSFLGAPMHRGGGSNEEQVGAPKWVTPPGTRGADCNPSVCPTPSLPQYYKREGSQLVTSQLTSHPVNIVSVTQDGPRGRADHAGNRGLHPQHLLVVTVPRCPPSAPCVHPSTRQQVTGLHSSRPSACPCDH